MISRSAAYAALTLLLGAAFAASEKIIEVLGEEWLGEGSKALAAGTAAAFAATSSRHCMAGSTNGPTHVFNGRWHP